MLNSTLITQLRQEADDKVESMQVKRAGDGTSTVYNLGKFPVIESSYTVYVNNVLKTETTDYELDKDNGDIRFTTAPPSGQEILVNYKYANWRDNDWVNAINNGIQELNARGFFRQIVRNGTLFKISASVQTYNAPSACVSVYEILQSDDYTSAGNFSRIGCNWAYQQDANKIVLGAKPSLANFAKISYLRNLQTYTATSATIDALDDWIRIIKDYAKAEFYRFMAGKIAKQGNANIDEGHFSFSNLRAQAVDLENKFDIAAKRKKPTRPAINMQWHINGLGEA